MSKNIVLLSDGTGNSSAKLFKTNVWRLFQILDLSNPARQIAFYDDGVGTSSFKIFAALGGIFGFGLKRNVVDIYSFCCRNYAPGDRIYGFGFSRGAFTIRVVAGLIAREGLVPYTGDEAALARYAADAYRAYRRRFNITKGVVTPLRNLRDLCIKVYRKVRGIAQFDKDRQIDIPTIHFLGVWDTVDAYGGPIEEMTRAIDYWIWPLSMPDRFLNAKVHRACHALSIEDERDAFRPVIWDERYVRGTAVVPGRDKQNWLFGIDYDPRDDAAKAADPAPHLRTNLPAVDRERISQVWFTGVHSDIGGGYPQDGLSHVTLDWMLDRAEAYGLKYSAFQRQHLCDPQINPFDKLNDSRKGFAGYYRYRPRNIKELYEAPPYKPSFSADIAAMWRLLRNQKDPQKEILADLHPSMARSVLLTPQATVHEAVFERIKSGTDRYVPVVMPAKYKYTNKAGAVTNTLYPVVDPGRPRSKVQDDVWNWIWLRRVVYFLTVFATLFVVSIPFFVIYFPGVGLSTVGSFVNPLVNAAASFLPGFLEPWFVAFRNAPGFVLAGLIAVGGFMWLGSNLQQTVRDVSRVAWHSPVSHPTPGGWHALVYWLRRRGIYRVTFYFLKHWLFPTAIIVWLFWWLAFGAANMLGLICKGDGGIPVEVSVAKPPVLDTAKACNATALRVSSGETYRISLKVIESWDDDGTATDPNGFDNRRAGWLQMLGWPYKRLIWSNWFATILRVGGPGLEEHLLKFEEKDGVWTTTFVPRSNGEVFLYVNDTVLSFPWIYDVFYRSNNHGKADVTIEKLPKQQDP